MEAVAAVHDMAPIRDTTKLHIVPATMPVDQRDGQIHAQTLGSPTMVLHHRKHMAMEEEVQRHPKHITDRQ